MSVTNDILQTLLDCGVGEIKVVTSPTHESKESVLLVNQEILQRLIFAVENMQVVKKKRFKNVDLDESVTKLQPKRVILEF